MSKHTTGPWHWEEGQPKITAEWNGKSYCVASVDESRLGWHEDRICESRERGANARLIAAAPDLLKACRLLIGADGEGMRFSDRVNRARHAIAKAEGR